MCIELLRKLLPLGVVLRVEEVRDTLPQIGCAPAEDARDRLVQRRADEREYEVDENQTKGDVECGEVEHRASLCLETGIGSGHDQRSRLESARREDRPHRTAHVTLEEVPDD